MNESLPLFAGEACSVGVAEDEADRSEEVGLARAIATDYYVQFG